MHVNVSINVYYIFQIHTSDSSSPIRRPGLRHIERRDTQRDTSSTSSPVRIGRGRGRSRVSVVRGMVRRGGRGGRSQHRGDGAADALLQQQRIS